MSNTYLYLQWTAILQESSIAEFATSVFSARQVNTFSWSVFLGRKLKVEIVTFPSSRSWEWIWFEISMKYWRCFFVIVVDWQLGRIDYLRLDKLFLIRLPVDQFFLQICLLSTTLWLPVDEIQKFCIRANMIYQQKVALACL